MDVHEEIDGLSVDLTSPRAANAAGIGVIFQEFNLIPELSAWENIFLGREQGVGWVRQATERRRAMGLFEQIGADLQLHLRRAPRGRSCGHRAVPG